MQTSTSCIFLYSVDLSARHSYITPLPHCYTHCFSVHPTLVPADGLASWVTVFVKVTTECPPIKNPPGSICTFPFSLLSSGLSLMTGSHQEHCFLPWLVWLSWLGIILHKDRSPVPFPVRARAWVAGHTPVRAQTRGNWLMFLFLSSSLPLSLKIYN